MATRAHLSIGDVLDQLRDEFPDITISKIRFLESQGLVDPERTPSGYRKFYAGRRRAAALHPAPAARALPAAEGHQGTARRSSTGARRASRRRRPSATAAPAARRVGARRRRDGRRRRCSTKARRAARRRAERRARVARHRARRRRRARRRLLGAPRDRREPHARRARAGRRASPTTSSPQLEEYGLVVPEPRRGDRVLFDDDALAIARVAPSFMRHGIEARHLRMYRTFAEREAVLFEQVLLPYRPAAQPRGAGAPAGDARRARRASGAGCAPRLLRQAVRDVRRVSRADARRRACRDAARRGRDRGARRAPRRARSRADHPDGVVLVGVLKGALIFLADLARAIRERRRRASTSSSISRFAPDSGRVQILHDLDADIDRPRRRARRGHRRHRPHAGVPDGPARASGTRAGCRRVRAARPARRAGSCRTTLRYRGVEIPDEFVARLRAAPRAICTATSRRGRRPTATLVAADARRVRRRRSTAGRRAGRSRAEGRGSGPVVG